MKRVAARGGEAHVPAQGRVRLRRTVPPDLCRRRNLIGRFFRKRRQVRRIATGFDKHATGFLAVVALAFARTGPRLIEPLP